MSLSSLYRLSGVALVLGGLLFVGAGVLQSVPMSLDSPLAVTAGLLSLIATLIVVPGFMGLYARVARNVGVVGLIGAVLIVASGIMAGAFLGITSAIILPWLSQVAPKLAEGQGPPAIFLFFIVEGILQVVGAILFGIVTMRKTALAGRARLAGLLLIIGGVGNFVTSIPGGPIFNILSTVTLIIFFVALIVYGIVLLAERQVAEEQVVPASLEATAGVK
jgi:hypothetical protein